MSSAYIPLIFFFYGLAFFSMGLAIILEIGHMTDVKLHRALIPLAIFGFIHAAHEWLEMLELMQILPGQYDYPLAWYGARLALLSLSFLSLAIFGTLLIFRQDDKRKFRTIIPLILIGVWVAGMIVLQNYYSPRQMLDIADVWTRYALAIPAAMIACIGFIAQQREFRKAGLSQFGRDSLWAAMAFLWYGAIGQTFTRASALPPSNVVNQELFWEFFGFPVQLLRAGVAIFAAIFVMRFLRSSEVETERQITELQDARLKEAQQRETLRSEMLRQIVSAQEAERKRIALELHDETGQALTAIGLGLRGVATTLRQDIDKASLHLRQLEGLVTQSLDELGRLISDLRPSHLDDLGLAATLRWYTKDIQSRTSLTVNFEILGDKKPLLTEVKTTLFRIAQEALTNVIKHADAKFVHLLLIYGETTVGIKIEDDGSGFDSHKLTAINHPHYGITGMKERASLLGGYFSIESSPGSGTIVEVIIPYVQKRERQEQ